MLAAFPGCSGVKVDININDAGSAKVSADIDSIYPERLEEVNFFDSLVERTVTVITDAGTKNEKEYKQTFKKGGFIKVYPGNDFYTELYTDSECIRPLMSTDGFRNATFYLKRRVDYSEKKNWAYYSEGEDAKADLFLIAPTVDVKDEYYMSIDDEDTKANFLGALNMERGIYEDSTRMFAPYYRQGADMCYRLLEDYFDDEKMQEKLVAVYAIGWPCTKEIVDEFPQIKPATSEADTGVVISIDCESPEVTDTFITPEGTEAYTINPLSWTTGTEPADKSQNLGACFTDYDRNIKKEIEGLCGCYIDEERGIVKVTDVSPSDYPAIIPGLPEGAYHIYDYQLFYRNLQDNVKKRVEAY